MVAFIVIIIIIGIVVVVVVIKIACFAYNEALPRRTVSCSSVPWFQILPFLFWKLLVSEFLLGISETLHCSMFAPHVKIAPLLDVQRLLMLFAGTLTYFEPKPFSFIIF
jgi:hypothetical protein